MDNSWRAQNLARPSV